jgi:hypothetical protein
MGPFLGCTPVDAPAECVIFFTFTMKMQRGRKVTKTSRIIINGVPQLALIYQLRRQ